MTAKEMIEWLQSVPPETEIKMAHGSGAFAGLTTATIKGYTLDGKLIGVGEPPDWETH